MAKGDTYYLIDKIDNNIAAKIVITDDYCTGVCYNAISWYKPDEGVEGADYEYFCEFYSKWDSCTHWWFKGEDYDEETDAEHDSYYHICGARCFKDHIRNMCFVWKVSAMVLLKLEQHKESSCLRREITDDYFDEEINNLIKLTLGNYTIKKEVKEDDQN